MLQVHFIGEAAVDDGGSREFFHLLKYLSLHILLGFPDHVVLFYNVEALPKSFYFIIGKMISYLCYSRW